MNEKDTPILPHTRISRHAPLFVSDEDRDNFVRNLVTVLAPFGGGDFGSGSRTTEVPLAKAAEGDPVVSLDLVKMHLRIEADITVEDAYLAHLEKAARLYTTAFLRRDAIDATVGENVKEAMLLLIAHWYRNRESVGEALFEVPLAYKALLSTERDYPGVY